MFMFMSILAFFMALAAFWFASEVAKRVDRRSKLLMQQQPNLDSVPMASLTRAEQQIRALTRGLESAQRDIAALQAEIQELEQGGLTPPAKPSEAHPAPAEIVASAAAGEWQKPRAFLPSGAYGA